MTEQPRLTILGKLAIFGFIAACFAGAYLLWKGSAGANGANPPVVNGGNGTGSGGGTKVDPATNNSGTIVAEANGNTADVQEPTPLTVPRMLDAVDM